MTVSVMATESKILCHFETPTLFQGKNYKAKCKHCGSMISASTKTCSNFTTHLKVSLLAVLISNITFFVRGSIQMLY